MDDEMKFLYDFIGRPTSIADYLDSLPYDEKVEVDLVNNRIHNISHVPGKYFVPVFDGSYQDLYRYCNDHMVHPEDRQIHVDLMDFDTIMQRLADSDTPGTLSAEFRYRLQNDEWRWVKQVVIGGRQNGIADGVVRFYVFDIASQKERELGGSSGGHSHHAGQRDEKTGMIREKEFFSRATDRLANPDCDGLCLIAIDIDQFKLFNDWYGREAGDYVLAQFGAYFTERESDSGWIAGYFGQDDFCVLMPYSEEGLRRLYADLNALIIAYGTSASGFAPVFGVSMAGQSAAILDLLDCALLASEAAKSDFRNRIKLFEPSMYKATEAEYRLLEDFQDALANGEITFYLQPQCRISTGKIVGAEALARWQKPNGTFVSPAEFVPVLEKYGFITDLDCFIWEAVCKRIKKWTSTGRSAVPISVNVSKHDIYALDVADHFVQLAKAYDIPPSLLKVEITESAYSDDTRKIGETARKLRQAGFMVLMDDFGSGYSSLNMLDNLGVDVIKLDMLFMHMNDADKRKSIHIIESVVNMAKTMGLFVITEGVETKEQAHFLQGIGCRYVQGYHFYRPMPCSDFEGLIATGEEIDDQGFAFKANDEFRIREFLDRNVYSDSMLNNILGAVALISWEGERVDIARYNEQFYELIGIPDLQDYLENVQQFVDRKYLSSFYELLEGAAEDQLNGSTGMIRFLRPDNTPIDLLLHFYFIGNELDAKKVYASARDVTALTEYRSEMKLLSLVVDASIVFLKKRGNGWDYNVEVHGLEDYLGMTADEFKEELRSKRFYMRIDPESARRLRELGLSSESADDRMLRTFKMTNARNETVPLGMIQFNVQDEDSVYSSVLIFQKVREATS